VGAHPQVVGLRDGLLALGYQETEPFVIGVHFTQGDLTALPAAARKPVEEAQAITATVQLGEVDGMLALRCCALNRPGLVLEAATPRAIPTMFETVFWVERGALASDGPDFYTAGWMAARLLDKIIKGANPAESPVAVNPKIELAITLKGATALGLTRAPEA
jgi:ABC transporter substrate binding protein